MAPLPEGSAATALTAPIRQILHVALDRSEAVSAWVNTLDDPTGDPLWAVGDTGARRRLEPELHQHLRAALDDAIPLNMSVSGGSLHYRVAPVRLPGGPVLGVLSVLGPLPDDVDDLRAVGVEAMAIAHVLTAAHRPGRVEREALERIERVLEGQRIPMVFQPIVDLRTTAVIGFEAFARFEGAPARSPDRWFADAARVDRGIDLEDIAMRSAISYFSALPPGAFLSINVGCGAVRADTCAEVIAAVDPSRLVIELIDVGTSPEQSAAASVLSRAREAGVRLAIDDAGGGFARLSEIADLEPDFVKIDQWLVRGIDSDPVKRSLVRGLVALATELGAQTIAEGIETEAEARTVRDLGVHAGQGNLFGSPGPLG